MFTNLESIGVSSGAADCATVATMSLDGVPLYGTGVDGVADDVKIISIDDSVPSITVDGGSWYGTDLSGGP